MIAARKIEELLTDDGSVLDTIAGAILRIFVRINQIEVVHDRIMRRLAALEHRRVRVRRPREDLRAGG
jgi:hypothetical protein